MNVLFVCLGNICRSPMAEAVFRKMVQDEGLENSFTIDSAGTGSWHIGESPHRGTLDILDQHAISSENLKARQVSAADFEQFDYIIAMDRKNIEDLKKAAGKDSESSAVVRLLDLTGTPKDVPDPYFTGDFEETYSLVIAGCRALLDRIKQEHSL